MNNRRLVTLLIVDGTGRCLGNGNSMQGRHQLGHQGLVIGRVLINLRDQRQHRIDILFEDGPDQLKHSPQVDTTKHGRHFLFDQRTLTKGDGLIGQA